jgi:carbon monoxide dehydrogenase subunit G
MQEVKVQAEVGAALEDVWSVFTDHAGWQRWAGVDEVVVRQPGEPAPNGLGAILVRRARGLAVEEEITAFEPPRRLVYQLVGGLPLRDHEGEVYFEPLGERTRIDWRVRFRPWLPGTGGLLAQLLRRQMEGVLRRLATQPFAAGRT